MGNLEERQDEHQGGGGPVAISNTSATDARQEASPSPSMGILKNQNQPAHIHVQKELLQDLQFFSNA